MIVESGCMKASYLAVLAGNLLALTSDLPVTWSSPMLVKLNNTEESPFGRPLTGGEESWIGSLATFGALFGSFPSGFAADRFGRRNTLLFLAIPFIASSLILAFAKTIALYYFARVLSGFSVGGVYAVLPMYIGEIAKDSNRGKMASSMNIFYTLGNCVPYVLGPYLPIMWFNLSLITFPLVFLLVFFFSAPESPYYLVATQKEEEAEKSLKILLMRDNVAKDLQLIKDSMNNEKQGGFFDMFKSRAVVKAFILSVALMIFQQMSGIDVILVYNQTIFEKSGSKIPSDISAILVGLMQFFASFFTPIVVDKLGRRLLLIISGVGIVLSQTSLGVYFYLEQRTDYDVTTLFWLPVTSLVLFIATYNIGFGPIPYTIVSEVFPSNVKAIASSTNSLICWGIGFMTAKSFHSISEAIGMGETFWLFSGACTVGVIYIYFFVPETKGKSFQQIQEMLSK